ncbi:MAG: DnaA/Hda family protein [Neomegalonema sp.]|nr:DnaA/Hda family protein [Neomegalonema sp.]
MQSKGADPDQLRLNLDPPPAARREELAFFVSESNEYAVHLLSDPGQWPRRTCLLLGPLGAGKSLLLQSIAPDAYRIQPEECRDGLPPLEPLHAGAVLFFEDVDLALANGQNKQIETALFHLLNRVNEEAALLIMTAQTAPATWRLRMPDLVSRLISLPTAQLYAPDPDLLAAILRDQLDAHGTPLLEGVIENLAEQMPRSQPLAIALAKQLQERWQVTRRPIDLQTALELLKSASSARPDGASDNIS